MPCQVCSRGCRAVVTRLQYVGTSTLIHARKKTMSLIRILSSKVHLAIPSVLSLFLFGISPGSIFAAFLTCPRIPLTVRMAAPSNLATSKSDVNIPLIRAVFLNILHGTPVSLIFFTIRAVLLNS
uniref:Uncharacterized protein n=1 Tax=Arundo donax TaxID=35708 RepID=A0A0A9EAB8_ARUDO